MMKETEKNNSFYFNQVLKGLKAKQLKIILNIKSKTQVIKNSLGQVVTPVSHGYEEMNKREKYLLESGSSRLMCVRTKKIRFKY
jgi:hypothetical protein